MSTEAQAADAPKGEVVASIAYVNGRRDREVPLAEAGQYVARRQGQSMLWIGLRNPSPETLAKVARELGACDKNQEEMLETHRRPKIIDYGNMILIVAITVEVEAERPIFGETQFLIGDGFLVTVRRGATAAHSPLRERLEASPLIMYVVRYYVESVFMFWFVV
jgi:magnesium transporter